MRGELNLEECLLWHWGYSGKQWDKKITYIDDRINKECCVSELCRYDN